MHQYLLEDKSEAEAELQKHEQFLQVLQQVRKLPVKYQEVITLKFFEGKTHREIAEILGVKEGTLKSLLSRGIQKIRQEGFSDEFNR
jgi:RNA polymerase sigma-70 factor (ECF subfamily)